MTGERFHIRCYNSRGFSLSINIFYFFILELNAWLPKILQRTIPPPTNPTGLEAVL